MTTKRDELHSDAGTGRKPAAVRRCAVTRSGGDRDSLLRFVKAPDGTITPDLDGRLPGRGVWVGGHRSLIEKAVASNAFAKSLKAPARVPSDLADRIEALLVRRLMDTLSLANKAGLVVCGFEKVDTALGKGHVAAVLHGSDAAVDGRSKIDRKFNAICNYNETDAAIVDILTIAQLGLALGRGSVVHAALTPGGLSDRFLEEAERLRRFRSLPIEPVDNSSELLTEG